MAFCDVSDVHLHLPYSWQGGSGYQAPIVWVSEGVHSLVQA